MTINHVTGFPVIRYPLSQVTPFTYRDGWTYLEVLENFRSWIRDELVPVVNDNADKMEAAYEGALLTFLEAVNDFNEFRNDADQRIALAEQAVSDVQAIFDELQANGPVVSVNGMHGIVEIPAVMRGELVVNVRDYGAAGDGVTDDFDAISAAIESAAPGATVFIPSGTYLNASNDALDNTGNGYIKIDKPLTFRGEAGTVLKDFAFWITGTADDVLPIGSNAPAGARSLNVISNNYAPGDYVQLLSEYNVYSTDAGPYQFGSVNPTTGKLWHARAAEIKRVKNTGAGNSVSFHDGTRYPYGISIADYADPLPNVTTAEARRLNLLDNVSFHSVTFVNETDSRKTSIVARLTLNLRFVECGWQSDINGWAVFISDSVAAHFDSCRFTHSGYDPDTTEQRVMLLIGAGASGTTVRNSTFEGGYTLIDAVTNDYGDNFPGGQLTSTSSELRTVTDTTVESCRFTGGHRAFTTHPANDGLSFINNTIVDYSNGIHARGRNAVISGNTIFASSEGVSISAFAHNTSVVGNEITQWASPGEGQFGWIGIRWNPFSTEIRTSNDIQNLNLSRNQIRALNPPTADQAIYGVRLYSNTTGIAEATLRHLSDITVTGNALTYCGISVGTFVNGVEIARNNVRVTDTNTNCIDVSYNASAVRIVGNTLDANSTAHLNVESHTTRDYEARNIIDANTVIGNTPRITVANLSTILPSTTVGNTTQSGPAPAASGPHESGATANVNVTFPRPFLRAPSVIVSPAGDAFTAHASNITETGFTMNYRASRATQYNMAARWIAEGTAV